MQLARKAAPDASVEFRIVDKSGNVRWIETSAVVIDWDDRPATLNYLLDITERKQAEIRLSEMVQELQIEQQMLEEKNIALREILSHIDAEKEAISRRIGSNLNHAILPTLIRLRNEANPATGRLLALLQRDIEEITSPFISTIKDRFTTLSPREVEICHLIKRGMSSKEIADMLSLSPMTIQKFRELIRKKLGLTNEDINLNTYLNSMK
jgi:ATP/maltotriose-dependent transcriptional regulator MalT